MNRNIYQALQNRLDGIGLEYEYEYIGNGTAGFKFKTGDDALYAMHELIEDLTEWGYPEGEYDFTLQQRFAFDQDEDADEKGIYKYKLIIEEF